MEKNVIRERGKDFEGPICDLLKGFPVTPIKIDSFKARLSKAIEELAYEEKLVLSLYHCEEMTIAEIGQILQKSERNITEVYLNAISNLRSKMHFNNKRD